MSSENKEECKHLLAKASNHLAHQLYRVLAKGSENVFFSPASISMAMAMLLRGAKGHTEDELRHVLGHNHVSLPLEEVHERCSRMLTVLNEPKDSYTLTMVNSLVHQEDFAILPEFKKDLQEMFQALVMEVDFKGDSASAVNKLNEWVKTSTRDMIPKVVDSLDPATVIVLLNAVYFKGMWMNQFDPSNTQPGSFYNRGNKEHASEVPMMFMSKKLLYVERENFKAVELPYQGDDISMLILLPNALDGIGNLGKYLESDFITGLHNDMRKVKVNLTLPKLHVEYSKNLKDVFREIGLSSIFEPGCNLEGINESEELMVSEIVHKAVLDVNEEGSEAAAVTAVVVMMCSLEFPYEFRADHPFMFVIYDKRCTTMLFMGCVMQL